MSIRSMSEEVLKEILARSNTPEFPIGLKDVDDVLWGLKRGKIHCVGGRTSMGKSSFMFFIANTLLKAGKKVGFLNLEMTNKEILERMFCMDLNIDNENMIKGKLTVADRYALEEYIGSMPEEHGLYVADRLDADWGNIMNIRHFLETNKVDCLFLDYIQMIRAVENQQERIQLGQFSVDLDRLSKEFNIPIVYGSQINRAGVTEENNGIPKLSNMRGSGVIEENCHAVIIVHWYWKAMMKQKDGSEYGGNDYAVYIAKNRGGRTGLKNVLFYPQYYNFENKDNEIAEEIFGGNNANRTGTKDFYTQNKGSIEDRFCKPSGDAKGQGSIGEGLG